MIFEEQKNQDRSKIYNILLMMELRPHKKIQRKYQIEHQSIQNILTLKDSSTQKMNKFTTIFRELDNEKIQQIWAVHGDYTKSRLQSLLSFIKEWKITKLYLWSNRKPNILKDIENIVFNNLRQLHLGWNNIESIEGISLVQMRGLRELVLRDNKITNIKSIKKCDLPHLQIVCLRGNFISDLNFFDWNFQNLLQLNLNDNFSTNLGALIKAEFKKIKILRLKSKNLFPTYSAQLLVRLKLKFMQAKTIRV